MKKAATPHTELVYREPVKNRTRLASFENSGTIVLHPRRYDLSDDEILDIGKNLARNIKELIPEARAALKERLGPFEEKLRMLRDDYDYHLSQLHEGQSEVSDARDLARVETEMKGVESQIKYFQLQSKVDISKLELDNELYSMKIQLGYEMRDVSCTWWVNWNAGRKRLIAVEDLEQLDERALTAEERQLSLLDFMITDEDRGRAAEDDHGDE
jgi:hypothetical protein